MTEVERLIREAYGLRGTTSPLPGERDHNFLLEGADGVRHVVKVHHPDTNATDLDLQDSVLEHLQAIPAELPRLVRTTSGAASSLMDGRRVRVLTWVSGTPWAAAGRHEAETLRGLGRLVARVDRALATFDHPALDTPHPWNIWSNDLGELRGLAAHIPDTDHRTAVETALDGLARVRHHRLGAQAIHDDANDHNVLLDDRGRVMGLIDFGDLCRAPRICGLAVACAYAMMDRPFSAVLPLVTGYHEIAPLEPAELEILYDLIRGRLAVSACMAVKRHSEDPDNAYLLVSQDGVRSLLARLDDAAAELAHLRFRAACGYEPVPLAKAVRDWLLMNATGPVCRTDLRRATVLDGWSADPAPPAIGRYLEDRAVYAGDAFATDDPAERRTLHLGADIFLPAGEPVLAAFDGIVHDSAWRPEPCDWGGIVVLEHRTSGGTPFFTLYGHLSPPDVTPGQPVQSGTVIGHLGPREENGGWPPHLHLQVLTTTLGMGAGVHGVAPRSDRRVWESISPDPNLVLGLPGGIRSTPPRERAELLHARRTVVSPVLSLAYSEPLTIVRGAGAYLYDEKDHAYLDMVNNVCHVGHAHPRVVRAAADQAARLNTNTRYLHPLLASYARRLAATCPDPLSVVFLVNSGSEANDLALRLARAHLASRNHGRRDVVVLDHAYHGNLSSLIDISPYKFNGPGGLGPPPHVRVAPLPDDAQSGDQVPVDGPVTFIAESLPGVAGQIVLPPGYLRAAYDKVRTADGICVADEVQVGFGRVGTHFWGFETQGAVPDIVTAGKPIGNGHPIGAVITTPEIARSFETGMEYFNTFGGNPVSCAAGLAVLDVIADERLQARAAGLGARLRDGLRGLASVHPLIGDVRGLGLFIGVELVLPTGGPGTAEASAVVEHARAAGVLLSTEGPHHNVLKIKPPLALSADDADLFLRVLDGALGSVVSRSSG